MTASETSLTPAATVILLREPLEVFLVRRHERSGFMADSFVFPGGKLDPGETALQAAVRELAEEAGVRVLPETLLPWSHWITPSVEPRRYDAKFFLAQLPEGQTAVHDQHETTDSVWLTPAAALEAHAGGALKLPPPTMRNLEELAAFTRLDELFAVARSRASSIVPILPKLAADGDTVALLLPWDPDYAQASGEGRALPEGHRLHTTPSRIVLREGRWWSR